MNIPNMPKRFPPMVIAKSVHSDGRPTAEDSHSNTAKGTEDNGFRGLSHKKVRKSVDRATAYTAYAVGDTIAEKSTAYALAQVFEPLFCGKHIDCKANAQEEVHKT